MQEDRRFEYKSHWVLDAPVALVWQALTEVEQWPRWWRHVRAVQPLNELKGVGAQRLVRWSTRLPYGFTLKMVCTEAQRERRLAGRSEGDLCGVGVWDLQPQGTQTHVHYRWRLDVKRPWMRWLAPVLAPLFAWNHHGVMRAGERGLRLHLTGSSSARQAPEPSSGRS